MENVIYIIYIVVILSVKCGKMRLNLIVDIVSDIVKGYIGITVGWDFIDNFGDLRVVDGVLGTVYYHLTYSFNKIIN